MRLVEGEATVEDLESFLEELTAVGEATGCTVQAFDARYVLDREHLATALARADRALERGENVARDRGMEVLLYAAGRRQIDRALEMGVAEGTVPAVVLVAASPDGEGDEAAAARRVRELVAPAETLGAYDPERVRSFFAVSDAELAATAGDLTDIVRERVALLDVRK